MANTAVYLRLHLKMARNWARNYFTAVRILQNHAALFYCDVCAFVITTVLDRKLHENKALLLCYSKGSLVVQQAVEGWHEPIIISVGYIPD